jgi:hypothetical protein
MSEKYEGNVGNYSFIMQEDDVIEVWSDMDLEQPETYIFVKLGSIKNQKDFEKEISFWWMQNKG